MMRLVLVFQLILLGCTTTAVMPVTFHGEEIFRGGDPDAIVQTIDHTDLPSVFVSMEKGTTGVQIFQKGTHSPYLGLTDGNNDGIFDQLSYYVLGSDGTVLTEIEDFNMDGQADLRTSFSTSRVELFYRGEWRAVVGEGSNRHITIDDTEVPFTQALEQLKGKRPF